MHSIRSATPADIPLILDLIRALATYEREPDAVKTTEADLLRDGFGEHPCFECLIAETDERRGSRLCALLLQLLHLAGPIRHSPGGSLCAAPVPRARASAKRCWPGWRRALRSKAACGCNGTFSSGTRPAIDFYQGLGAQFLDEWRIMRVNDEAIGGPGKPGARSRSR